MPPHRAPTNWATISQAPVMRSRRPVHRQLSLPCSYTRDTVPARALPSSRAEPRTSSTSPWGPLAPYTMLRQMRHGRAQPKARSGGGGACEETCDQEAGSDSWVQLTAGTVVSCANTPEALSEENSRSEFCCQSGLGADPSG